jgi:putative isomerase
LEWAGRALLWNRFYDHRLQQQYVTMHRLPGRSLRGDALSWDALLLAAMMSLIEPQSARATIRAVLAGQTPDGRVPLRRQMQIENPTEPPVLTGRTMPPIGALCVWKIYQATRDLELLAWAYPRLQRWNDWWHTKRGSEGPAWRDGDNDGLLEWGFDAEAEYGALGARTLTNAAKQRLAFSESGLGEHWSKLYGDEADSTAANAPAAVSEPKFNDKTHTLEFSPVALNALYALDTEMLMLIARELGLSAEAARWEFRYEELKKLINEKMWSTEDGAYLSRRWDGQFIRRFAAEDFYVLAAGIPDDERARRMAVKLRIAQRAPTTAPMGHGAETNTDSKAERATLWAPTNYLLYLGLKRYQLHEDASALAQRSTAWARQAWDKQGQLDDLFTTDGRALTDEQEGRRTSFAGLMFWPGVEELLSIDPWLGLTLGRLRADAEARVERLYYDGARWDVISSAQRTVVRRNGQLEVEVEGPAILRGYRSNERTVIFTIEIKEQLRLLVPAIANRKITVSVDDKILGSTSIGAAANFRVSAGVHKVLIVK